MSSTTITRGAARVSSDTALSRHMRQCDLARGRWFGAAMLAEELHRLMAPRFATTVMLAAVVLVACTWL
jgi:hypothetical protein